MNLIIKNRFAVAVIMGAVTGLILEMIRPMFLAKIEQEIKN